jgi:hypothetical protein
LPRKGGNAERATIDIYVHIAAFFFMKTVGAKLLTCLQKEMLKGAS